jgi:Papain-like cysteine protease AvrRpt2
MADAYGWGRQRNIPGVGTSFGPSLAAFNGRLYAAWKGINSDQGIYWASFDGNAWGPQHIIPAIGTSTGPSLCFFNGHLYAAWKGINSDQGIYWSFYDGNAWAAQGNIPGVGTSLIPSLTVFQNRLYACWKGINNDQGLYFSSFDGNAWAPQRNIPGVGSSTHASLAVFQNRLYAIWKGINSDQGIYFSSFDGNSWVPQRNIPGVGSSFGPSLAVYQNFQGQTLLYAAWKGIYNDQGIYFSSFDGNNWAPQQNIANVGTSVGPAIAPFANLLYAAWKGENSDQGIYWSLFFDLSAFNTSINFSMQPQTQTNWCWSAVSVSTSKFYNSASQWTQCSLANQQLGQSTCCQSGGTTACNQAWYLDQALTETDNLDAWQSGTVTQQILEGEIVRRFPVGVRIGWSGGGGHFVIVDGATTSNSTIHVEDPIYGTSDIAYSTLASSYQGSGSWTHTYFTRS